MASLLGDLCPHETFRTPWEYKEFMRSIKSLIAAGTIMQIEPKVRSQWDLYADFFYDPGTEEIFMLHHPEAPYHGEWVKVSRGYLENPAPPME
jgi:hypothetical protein